MIQRITPDGVCARHNEPLVTAEYIGGQVIEGVCPKCYFWGSCPVHPQSGVWKHEHGDRCPLCGYFYDGRDPPPEGDHVVRTFAHYREEAKRTDGDFPLAYYAGGLCEEAGELWRLVKRQTFHGHPAATPEAWSDELGDALWLLDGLARKVGLTLEEVAARNVAKLRDRYPEGWSTEASRNRKDGG